MRSTWLKRPVDAICISALLGLSWFVEPASAWQFRELDESDVTETAPVDDTDVLIPTTEEFIAPIVDARELDRVTYSKIGATVAEITKEEPKLEPVPAPELHLTDMPTSALAAPHELDSMSAFEGSESDRQPTLNPRRDVRAAKFSNVQAGTTTLSELIQLWGGPIKTLAQDDGSQTLIYKIPSFRQVDVTVRDDVVASVLVHLSEPLAAAHVAAELNLTEFVPVPIPDEFGEVLGQAYPERGLLFNFTEDINTLLVSAILMEPITGEMFGLRAQHDFDHQYERSLADLDEAIRLDPDDSDAYWLMSQLQDASGRTRDAIRSAQKAVRLHPTNPLYRITRARLLAKTNRANTAIEEVRAVLDEIDMPAEVAARAHCLLGDLLAVGPDADQQEALKHHLRAISFATKVVDDRRFAVRRMAKHVLVDAHMSVARDIATGNFQRQKEVVPKWLLRATELADEFITDDNGDELLRLHILRNTLASYVELQGNFDAAIASAEALQSGRQLIADATDQSYKMQVERLLAETLMHSAKIKRSRARYDSAMKYANNALALLKDTNGNWQETSHDRYLQGQLYFLVGSIYAVQQEDHDEAVDWYKKARDIFVDSDFISPLYNHREQGDMYVSMGLSFWGTGEHDQALQLTQIGAELMKEAVEAGTLQLDALVVPYGNLATMHAKMGHHDQSQDFAKLVSKVEKTVPDTKRR